MSAAIETVTEQACEVIGFGNDDGWRERRLSGVGASEAAMVLGLDPRHEEGGPAVLWAWKTGRAEPEDLDGIEFIEWGHRMEPVIVAAYSEDRYAGRPVRKTREHLRSVAHPWALATLDAWTRHPVHGWIPLEAKNVSGWMADRWVDGTPVEMWWQLQHQMFVTGTPCASIAACVGGNALTWEDVDRDPVAQAKLAQHGAAFWRCVEEDRVPLHVPTLASVRAIYPVQHETGSVQLTGDEWTELDERLVAIKAEAKELRAERDEIEARLKDAIGPLEEALLPSGARYSNRTQERAETTIKSSTFRVLRRHKAPGGS